MNRTQSLKDERAAFHILVAEDDPQVAGCFRQALQEAGYSVAVAADGEEALTLARGVREPFAVALVDWSMPLHDGGEVIAELRRCSPETIPVLVTGSATTEEVGLSYRSGAHCLIQKPLLPTALLSYVAALGPEIRRRRDRAQEQKREASRPPLVRWLRRLGRFLRGTFTSRAVYTPAERGTQILTLALVAGLPTLALTSFLNALPSYPPGPVSPAFGPAAAGDAGRQAELLRKIEGYLLREERLSPSREAGVTVPPTDAGRYERNATGRSLPLRGSPMFSEWEVVPGPRRSDSDFPVLRLMPVAEREGR